MKTKRIQKLVILIFVSYLALLTVFNCFWPKKTYSENENRYLAEFPSLSPSNVFGGDFDDQFESWFSDHFIGRDLWIELKALSVLSTGTTRNNDVYLAKEHLVRRFQTYNKKILNQNMTSILEFCDSLDHPGTILIVPTAADMEKQLLPAGSWNLDQASLIHELQAQAGTQKFIDLTPVMDAQDDLYFRTDHHWNEKGAYLAYREICHTVLNKEPEQFTYEQVSNHFKGTLYSRSGYFWHAGDPVYRYHHDPEIHVSVQFDDHESDSLYSDQRLDEKDQYMYYLDGNHPYVKIQTDLKNHKKAVIIKDSYAHILVPYLAYEYEQIEMIDLRYYRDPVSELIEPDTDIYFIYSLDNFTEDPYLAFLR
ncbi:MAG: hypothetical protein IJJ44_11245 [Solobacterium sp.]|nr:hypothetical protein [Solobacterium sp.]